MQNNITDEKDKKTEAPHSAIELPGGDIWRNWRGLGGWNYYFLLKFSLIWLGYLNFHPFANLIFAAFLLFPLPSVRWHKIRHYLAIIPGIALFYYDTWLPGLDSILNHGTDVTSFSPQYLLELAQRFINPYWLGGALVLGVAYLFLSQWIRVTFLTLCGLIILNVQPLLTMAPASSSVSTANSVQSQTTTTASNSASAASGTVTSNVASSSGALTANNAVPATLDNAALNDYQTRFYAQEKQRSTNFPTALPSNAQPFDVLIINICSMAWADLNAVGQAQHPLWQKFDLLFSNFNSATSYSGPASIRLLRASCGQPSHDDLYKPAEKKCYLFDNLNKLGFTPKLVMDHSGQFGNYLKELRANADLQAELMPQEGLPHQLTAFDGEPIYDTISLLNRWKSQLLQQPQGRTATFVNLISMHDGNHFAGTSKTADYGVRTNNLLDQLNQFFTELEQSGRKVMVVVIPEHGAALTGDKMQLSGLRDIPSPSITHIPVGIKWIGMQAPHSATPLMIDSPSSYLAVSELISRTLDGHLFNSSNVDWKSLTADLPQIASVSENSNAVVISVQGKPYVQLNGKEWLPYPQN